MDREPSKDQMSDITGHCGQNGNHCYSFITICGLFELMTKVRVYPGSLLTDQVTNVSRHMSWHTTYQCVGYTSMNNALFYGGHMWYNKLITRDRFVCNLIAIDKEH